jgi:hypothetical protein
MTMMRCLTAAVLTIMPAPALAWGNTGHRITGAIAERHLDRRARAAIRAILGTETLAQASTWPDFMRQSPDPFWRTAGAFHSVVVPDGGAYDEPHAPPGGDAMTALRRFGATVRDRKAPVAERQRALRFIIHIVGDLHQPLHACNGRDHCGGDVQVTFFGSPMNLHAVWDYALIDHQQLSFSEWAAWLDAPLTRERLALWSEPDPAVWVAESAALRDTTYPGVATDLGKEYAFANTPIVEDRLAKAGVRLAAYLNSLFDRHRD